MTPEDAKRGGRRRSLDPQSGEGEVRTFEPGAAVLLEDTTGVGHRTRVVGDEPWLAIVVVLA